MLTTGDAVAVVAPASWITPDDVAPGIALLQQHGLLVRHRADLFAAERYFAGSDQRRADELSQWLVDPQIKAIFCGRGGYGCQRIIPRLDPRVLRHPKFFVGYSDMTILQGWLARHAHWTSVYGPTVRRHLTPQAPDSNLTHLLRLLTTPTPLGALPTADLRVIKPGTASGVLTGGCLTLLHAALGTDYAWPLEGILFLEDTGEKIYALDRMLTHLQHAGALKNVTGILFGSFTLHPDEPAPELLDTMLADCLRDFPGPVVAGFPAGHADPFFALPLGCQATLSTAPLRFMLDESAVSH